MNYKNKPSLFKRESFYIILFLVLAIVATIVAIAVRNSSKQEESKVSTNTTSAVVSNSTVISSAKSDLSSNFEDPQGPENSLQVKNENSEDENLANVTENNVNLANDTNSAIDNNENNAAVDVTPKQETIASNDVTSGETIASNDVTSGETIASNDVTVNNESVSNESATKTEVTDENANSNNSDSEQVSTVSSFNFLKPIAGQIITDYDTLIEGKTENGNQWITFSNGIEISATVGTPVKAAADGNILAINKDLNGAIVTIDHGNGMKTVYKNLDEASLLVKAGDKVTQDEQIGNIGEVRDAYIEKGPRLCFELIKNGEYQDPLKYIRN